MDDLVEEFVAWVLAPERTLEEAFAAEILMDEGLSRWRSANQVEDPLRYDHEARREYRRKRRLNPAHRRSFTESEVRNAAIYVVHFGELKHWASGDDRLLRDLSVFRFCPKMVKLHLAPTELTSLEGLRYMPLLEDFWLQEQILEDYSGLEHCPRLLGLHLWLHYPWCNLQVLARLPHLENLTLHANLPMLRDVGPLLQIKKVLFNGEGQMCAPGRNCAELPDMPLLREAVLYSVASLEGVEKFVSLEQLEISGVYKSLAPFASLPLLRKLTLHGNKYSDLSPLAAMPELSVLILPREYPLDYTPLLDSPKLREIKPGYGKILSPEQAGINAALGGWDGDFLLSVPRPLPKPLYRFTHHRENAPAGFERPHGDLGIGKSAALKEAEGLWMKARLERAMERKFGRNWGEAHFFYHAGSCDSVSVNVYDIEIADQLPEVVALLREELRWTRNRWIVVLSTDLHNQWQKDPDAWKDPFQEDLEQRLDEARDQAARRREYLAYLERLKVFELRKEQGDEPAPGEFASPAEEEDDEEDSDVLDEPEEGVEDAWESEHHPRRHDYYLRIVVCEEGVWSAIGFFKCVQRLLLQTFEKYPGWGPEEEKYEKRGD